MNCDRIAPFYEWIEKAAFGGRLQRHRVTYLAAAAGKRRALVLGDGDGRFAAALAAKYPELCVDSVEMSAGMVREARKRLAGREQVRVILGDVFCVSFELTRYEVVYTHFFLDCFDTETAGELIRRLLPALTRDAAWVISDFREAASGWRKLYTRTSLATMYLFFRFATGLNTKRLPDYAAALRAAGFRMNQQQVSMAGFIASEWWQR